MRFLYAVTLEREWVLARLPFQKRHRKLPVVLSTEEVTQFLASIPDRKMRAVLVTAYAAGLRVFEVVALRAHDIDSERMVLRVVHGTWTGSAAQFNALSFTAGEDGSYGLTVSVDNTNAAETANASASYTLAISAKPEAPVLGGSIGAAAEDGAVTLGLTANTADGDDTLGNVTISGLPLDLTGVSGGSYDAVHGTWTGSAAQFNALSFTAGEDGTYNLSVSVSNTTTGEAATTTLPYALAISAKPEAPLLSGPGTVTGINYAPVSLGLSLSRYDTDDSGVTLATITGVPSTATLSSGTKNVDGSWTVGIDNISGLTITQLAGTETLTVTATNPEAGGATSTVTVKVSTTFQDGITASSAGYWAQHETSAVWKTTNVSGGPVTFNAKDTTSTSGVLLGDKAGGPTLFIASAAASQQVSSSDSASDTRQILLKQALAAELNIENGAKAPGSMPATGFTVGANLISDAVKWLTGQKVGTNTLSFISAGNIDTNNNNSVLDISAEYNTTKAAFTSPTMASSSLDWAASGSNLQDLGFWAQTLGIFETQ